MSAPTAVYGGTAPLAALTAVFTPPCPTSWLLTTTRLPSQYPPFPTTGPASCDPPSWRTNIAKAGFRYYSPAICPSGFVVGPNCSITKTRTEEGFPAIAPGETAVYCVPSGLTCTTDITDYRGGVWGFARDATTAGARVTVGPAIQIRWVEADLTALETHPLTPGLRLATTQITESPAMASPTNTDSATEPTEEPEKNSSTDGGGEASHTLVTHTAQESFGIIHETALPTSTPTPTNTAEANSRNGGIGSLDRTTSIVVIVVVTVVAGVALWVGAFLFVRRYKKKAAKLKGSPSSTESGDAVLDHSSRRHTRMNSGAAKSILASPASELDAGPPAIGSTPNPAELEGDSLVQNQTRAWVHQRLWLRSPGLQPPQASPRSMPSTRSAARRTVRESFGEKVNDPAAALSRLKIPNPLSLSIGRPSPGSASPGTRTFWRRTRSPRSPAAAAAAAAGRLSAQLPKPSPRSGLNGNVSRASTPWRGKPGWQGETGGAQQRDAMP